MTTLRILALCATFAAACAHKQEALPLRYKFTQGQTDRYKVDLTVLTTTSEPPPTGKPTQVQKPVLVRGGGTSVVKVEKVEADGSADLTSNMADFRIGGRPSADGAQISKYTLSALGVATVSGAPKPVDHTQKTVDPRILARLSTILPQAAVKPGDTWKNKVPDPLTGGGSVEVTARLFRMETLDGVETARIHQSMTIPMSVEMPDPQTKKVVKIVGMVTVTSAINFDPAAGKVLRSSVSGHGVLREPVEGVPASPDEPPSLDFKIDVVATLVR
jgi:hypothetical protein